MIYIMEDDMQFDENLFNAAIVGENPEMAFIVEGKRLHAVEKRVALREQAKSNLQLVLPLMRNALQALVEFAKAKVPSQFTSFDLKEISLQPTEYDQLIEKMRNIYSHLPHTDRRDLSSLIHHKAH
jgi:hypothetical protein